MALDRSPDLILVADIGGTSARFGCFDLSKQQLRSRCSVAVADHANIYEALDAAKPSLPDFDAIDAACIAIAGPIKDDWIRASNSPWAFSRHEMQLRYGWSRLLVINDFLAAAYGTLQLEPDNYRVVGRITPALRAVTPTVVIGPGTGLGVAALFPSESQWRGFATEGGHARLAPDNEEDLALLAVLQERMGSVQREDVLSGRGLCNLYNAWMTLRGEKVDAVTNPAQITAEALRDADSPEAEVLNYFCGILGTVAADVALEFAAWEGVYLAGGILPRIVDFFALSPFRQRFESHPQFADYLRPLATAVITEDSLGLLGAARYLQETR